MSYSHSESLYNVSGDSSALGDVSRVKISSGNVLANSLLLKSIIQKMNKSYRRGIVIERVVHIALYFWVISFGLGYFINENTILYKIMIAINIISIFLILMPRLVKIKDRYGYGFWGNNLFEQLTEVFTKTIPNKERYTEESKRNRRKSILMTVAQNNHINMSDEKVNELIKKYMAGGESYDDSVRSLSLRLMKIYIHRYNKENKDFEAWNKSLIHAKDKYLYLGGNMRKPKKIVSDFSEDWVDLRAEAFKKNLG